MDYKQLIEKAKEALENAHVPYSHYTVGAAVLTEDGNVYSGCNIENASYGATVCAERVAIFKAVSNGREKNESYCPCKRVLVIFQHLVEFADKSWQSLLWMILKSLCLMMKKQKFIRWMKFYHCHLQARIY